MATEEMMRITASPGRRLIGVAAMGGLGALLLYLALTEGGMELGWKLILVLGGGLSLWLAHRMWEATGHALILTDEALMDSDGTVIARLDNIEKVDRSAFAMKPSNGFLVVLKEPEPRVWRPGLWWRIGRRVAVGGVTSGAHTRPMADMMKLKLSGDLEL
ncbi:hypothetical protein [Antarctobacter jejuensis]|uniref:hypothetical protein n=1 Tax=Antarctobacter jejuensis TaxID=1439938 RepID=UPI003FD0708A